MKKVLFLLLAVLALVGCNQDDTVTPPTANFQYTAEVITNLGNVGWSVSIEYAGEINGYQGEFPVNVQSHDTSWRCEFGSEKVCSLIYFVQTPSGKTQIGSANVCYNYTEVTVNGVTTRIERGSGGGWSKIGDQIYTVQIDFRNIQ